MSLTSPLASPAEASFRPEDKALDMLFPSAEDPLTDSFSQYVNEALFDLSEDDKDFQFLGDIVDLFDKDSYTNGANGLPPSGTSARHSQSSPQPWRKGLWCLNGTSLSQAQTIADEQHCTSIEISKKAVATPCTGVASLDVIEQPCRSDTLGQTPPPSQPSSPLHCETKKMALSPRLGFSRHHPYKRLDLDRSSSPSPAPVTAKDQLKTSMAYQEPWHNTQQALQNFSFNPQDDDQPISPPSSGRAAQPTNMASVMQNSAVMPLSMLGSPQQYGGQESQLIGENFEPQGFELPPTTAPVLPESHQQPIPTWTSDDYEPQSGTELVYPMTGDLSSNPESQGWWAQTHSHDPTSQVQGQQGYYPFLAAPVPHRPAHTLLQHGSNLQTSGLMIQCPDQITSDMSSPQAFSPSSFSPNTGGGFSPQSVYPPPPQQGQCFPQQADPFNTPRRMSQQRPRKQHQQSHQQPPRSPSSSPSLPLSLSPTSASRRSSSRSHSHSHSLSQSQSQTNRRNSHDRTVRRQKSSTHTHASTSSISKTPRTPRTPKSSSGGGGGRGSDVFYNLTQDNHDEILKSVAPSGSSKTREKRRAQEREKERRDREVFEVERRKREALERKVRALSREQSGEEGAAGGGGGGGGRIKREPEG